MGKVSVYHVAVMPIGADLTDVDTVGDAAERSILIKERGDAVGC